MDFEIYLLNIYFNVSEIYRIISFFMIFVFVLFKSKELGISFNLADLKLVDNQR